MRRINTATAADDLFGAGKDGFTDGSAPSPPPTHLNATWFNNAQEEIARAVEGNGATVVAGGSTENYFQLDDAIGDMARVVAASSASSNRYITEGLTFDISGTSLSTTLAAGRMVFDGRRYVITAAKLGSFASWGPLTASRDHYFFIAPEDPDAPATPPNRATVHIERSDVANGASAPSTPTGMILFAKIVASGTDLTSVTYYNRGPRLMAESQGFVALRPNLGTDTRTAFHPSTSIAVDLGFTTTDSQQGYFSREYVEELHVRSTASSLFTYADNYRYTFVKSVAAAGAPDELLLNSANFPDGTSVYIEVKGVAFDLTDPTDSYSFRLEGHAHLDGGAPLSWDLDGTGGVEAFEGGAGGIAAGMGISIIVDGGDLLKLSFAGHATDATRWFCEVHIIVAGD